MDITESEDIKKRRQEQSQDEKNTDVTPGMQNCSVYPKLNCDEANFPCIGSIIPRDPHHTQQVA